jgi:DNA-binding response OmpR family regulator
MFESVQTKIVILAIDDDSSTRESVSRTLEREGYNVLVVESAEPALAMVREYRPDVIILDTMLPDMSGYEFCSHLRSLPFVDQTPVLFLSDYQSAQQVAMALDCGGDDYLRKPFVARELNARVRALLRRANRKRIDNTTRLRMDGDNHRVIVNGRTIQLTPTEFQLFDYMCRHQSKLHTAVDLLEEVWQYEPGNGDTALVRNHIRNLRRKIETDPDHPSVILSLHGRGYTVKAAIVS